MRLSDWVNDLRDYVAVAREFMETPTGKRVAVGIGAIGVLAVLLMLRSALGPRQVVRESSRRVVICAKTGKSFTVTVEPGMSFPLQSSYSGEKTAYPAEMCGWTAGGEVASQPHAVLLNSWINQPEPTFCPVCGRLVVRHNPPAEAGAKAPPTEAELKARFPKGPFDLSEYQAR
jgi:hypothetical protein